MRILLAMLMIVSAGYGQERPLPEQGPPPKNLARRADGRFSANGDPANPEKFETYTVKQGDTLSMIAGQVLKDSRLWPQLWEQNEQIVNPHWIYPGDKILIKPITTITEAAPPAPQPPPPPPPAPAPPKPAPAPPVVQPPPAPPPPKSVFDLTPRKPAPEVKQSDVYCSGFIRKEALPADLTVIGKFSATGSALAVKGDYVYISQGAEDGVKAGDMFQVIRPTRKIESLGSGTKSSRNLGMHYLDVAQIQVVTTQADSAMARVSNSCEAIELGDIMMPFQRMEVPLIPIHRTFSPFMTAEGGLTGTVVITQKVLLNFGSMFKASGIIAGTHDAPELLPIEKGVASAGDIVYLDLGSGSGAKPGDLFIVYRTIEVNASVYGTPKGSKKLQKQKTAIGEVVILKVDQAACTALVTYTSDGVEAGDFVARR